MFETIAKMTIDAVMGDPQDKDRAQSQLDRVIDRRFNPCIEFWEILWDFAEKVNSNSVESNSLENLSESTSSFIKSNGALVSLPLLQALFEFKSALDELPLNPPADFLQKIRINKIFNHLLPQSDSESGKENPGLLLLLRDQIGSNTNSASARF